MAVPKSTKKSKKKGKPYTLKACKDKEEKKMNEIILEQARREHQLLSKAMIEHDNAYLLLQYGCLKNAADWLQKLEHFLNYKGGK